MTAQKDKKKTNYGFIFRIFYFGIFIASIISGCNLPSQFGKNFSNVDTVAEFSTYPVTIKFQLNIHSPMRDGEYIILELVDDVTGSIANNKTTKLEEESELIFYTTLNVPAGSVIKYRYIKISDGRIQEISADNEPIDYRVAFASNNAVIKDILQLWKDEISPNSIGLLEGSVIDRATNQPIPDILVFAGGKRTFTGANGYFQIEGLSAGVHNVVFYAIDGQFLTFQQEARIDQGKITQADVSLEKMPEVRITFNVTPPHDAIGAPIRLAGNIIQLGSTFSDISNGSNVNPTRMPTLIANPDGTYSITLNLFAKTDLRYKFTLGNGFWNAEQNNTGGFRVRQLIVPDEDSVVEQSIESWRSPGIEPIAFNISIPIKGSPIDDKFIQFKIDEWSEPIPLWPLGNEEFLYILFSPLENSQLITYRFCRNGNCIHARDQGSLNFDHQVLVESLPQTVSLSLDSWENWVSFVEDDSVIESYVPVKESSYGRIVELTPDMDASWYKYASLGVADIEKLNANSIIISLQEFVRPNSPNIHPVLGITPFYFEISSLVKDAKDHNLKVGLFPQIGPINNIKNWLDKPSQNDLWRESFFNSYYNYILNYANIAEQTKSGFLILGGKGLFAVINENLIDENEDTFPTFNEEEYWLNLIKEIKNVYHGELIWAVNLSRTMDPLPNFIEDFDGIYVLIDSPLALGDQSSYDDIQSGFINLIDSEIYEVYRSTDKSITLGFGYPALELSAKGCTLLGELCFTDGLFRADQISQFAVDFNQQATIYNAIIPIAASREWISGISIRGYEPTVDIHSPSSSIRSKPAEDVIKYWFTNMKP